MEPTSQNIREQNSNSSQQNEAIINSENKTPMLLKIILALEWLVYLPIAGFIFMMSGMAGDSPHTPWWEVLVMLLLINGTPLLVMIGSTILSLKRNSFFLAFLPIFVAIMFPVIINLTLFFLLGSPNTKEYISFTKVVPQNENLFVCEGEYVLKYYPETTQVHDETSRVTSKGWNTIGTGGELIGEKKYGKFTFTNQRYMDLNSPLFNRCKNPSGETIYETLSADETFPRDISFDAIVPKEFTFFVCPSEKVLEVENNKTYGNVTVYDVTRRVTKKGWQPQIYGISIGGSYVRDKLFPSGEDSLLAMKTCKNPDGKTISEVTGRTLELTK